MNTEYTVMQQVGEEEPVASDFAYDTYERAERAVGKAWNNLPGPDEGIPVYSPADAISAASRLERAKITRYFVGKRQVGEWEEANSWEEE